MPPSHVHGALSVMRGVSRSDAQAARLPSSGHCQGREHAERMHNARTRTSHQRDSTAPQGTLSRRRGAPQAQAESRYPASRSARREQRVDTSIASDNPEQTTRGR